MRYLIYIGINGRTFVFSAHNPADQRMWLAAFEVYFQLKFIADCVKNNKPIPKNLLKQNQPKKKIEYEEQADQEQTGPSDGELDDNLEVENLAGDQVQEDLCK